MDVKRDAEDIWRERVFVALDMEGSIDCLLKGLRDLRQRLRADKRDGVDARDKAELLVRYIDEAGGLWDR